MPSSDPNPTPLAALASLLESEEYTVLHAAANEHRKSGELLFNALDEESEEDGQILPVRVIILNTLLDDEKSLSVKAEPVGALMLHCATVFPFVIPESKLTDVMQAALLVNRMLPLCSYGVSVEDRSCFLQACICLDPAAAMPEAMVLETIQMICHAVQSYGPLIEQITEGELTYAGFRRELERRGTLPPPIPVRVFP